jgi:RNA polymerase sigma-70 factor, ECF subfamily
MIPGEQELALAAAAGAPQAFARLLEAVYDRIYRTAYRITGAREDAEDVAQDVCVKLASAIRTFRGEARFATFLHRMTFNAAIDLLRGRAPTDGDDGMAELPDARPTPEGNALNADLWRSVRRLPARQRDAVILIYAEDMSHKEAAEVLDCSEATVSWHLHEARKALKLSLQAAE